MAKFEVGDWVVRSKFRDGLKWQEGLARSNRSGMDLFQVQDIGAGVYFSLVGMGGNGELPWSRENFRLATSLEIHQGMQLPTEDHIAEGKEHVDSLREKVASLEAELAKCCGTVADKPLLLEKAAELESELTAAHFTIGKLNELLAQVYDQRDAAVIAAKSLGGDAHQYKRDIRDLMGSRVKLGGMLERLSVGLGDLDLESLHLQLNHIGGMCEEQGNGADAQLAWDSANALRQLHSVLTEYRDIPYDDA